MAPPVHPWPLFRICLSASSSLIDQACTNIFLEHGSYGNQECTDAIGELQNYLIQSLPLTIFENLSEDRNSRTRNQNPLLLWSKDPRIKLGLFLHPSIRKFSVDGKGNELMLMQQQDELASGGMGGLDEIFWCAHIRRLSNLIYLNLNLITTDEILLLIGNYCQKLEIVNIVSRIKQDNVTHEPNQDGGPQPMFPGITLKFCVSDVGLAALLKCQSLHKITMNKITNQSLMPSNKGITLNGVRSLVKGLPKLEYISFGSMGKILHSGFKDEKLKLTYYSELDPTFVNIPLLQSLCPRIAHLSLSVPITINTSGNIDANTDPCEEILTALANSNLPLKTLELQHFPYCPAFEEVLLKKGQGLQELLFRAINPMSSKHLVLIGEHCKHLQKLQLKELGPEPDWTGFVTSASLLEKGLFSELRTLHLSGRGWNPKIVLPVMLMSASKVSKLSLLNMSSRLNMDQSWNRVLTSNKLLNLVSISLYSGCIVSVSLVRKLVLECPKLNFFSFIQSENMELAEVERLRLEVSKKNLNIKLTCLEMFEV